jgi:hypothetical protein
VREIPRRLFYFMNVNQLFLSGILLMEQTLNNPTFIWKGETFNCVPSSISDEVKAVDIGYNENGDFNMTVRLNQFTPNVYPALNDFITYLGYKLLIKKIKKPAHGVYWVYQAEIPKIG